MGEVFRARDTKLGREVALKLVLQMFVDDHDRLVRFERGWGDPRLSNQTHVVLNWFDELRARAPAK